MGPRLRETISCRTADVDNRRRRLEVLAEHFRAVCQDDIAPAQGNECTRSKRGANQIQKKGLVAFDLQLSLGYYNVARTAQNYSFRSQLGAVWPLFSFHLNERSQTYSSRSFASPLKATSKAMITYPSLKALSLSPKVNKNEESKYIYIFSRSNNSNEILSSLGQ